VHLQQVQNKWGTSSRNHGLITLITPLGHYIAGVANDIVGKLNMIMANAQLINGMAPARWTKMLNGMLKKLAGNDNVKKLRIIMLVKADFNSNNK